MNNNGVNNLVNKCVELVNNARSTYNDSDEMKAMLYVSFVVFLLFYGDKVINKVYDLFKNVNIYCENDTLENIVKKYADGNEKIIIGKITKEENARSFYDGYHSKIFISKTSLTNELELTDRLIHELNHVFVGTKCKILDNNLYVFTGFACTLKIAGMVIKQNGVKFNEAINSLTSEEMINLLIGLSKFKINNKIVRDYLKIFKKYKHYYTFSYTNFVDTLRDFYNVDEIKLRIKYSFINNDYKILESYINYVLYDDNGYHQILLSLEKKEYGKVKKLVSNI